MVKGDYAILAFIGIILMFLSLYISPLINLLIFSLSILLVSIFNILDSSNAIKLVTDLLLLAGTLSLISFFFSLIGFRINLSLINYVSIYIIVFAIVILAIYYLYDIIKDILSSIEVRIKK